MESAEIARRFLAYFKQQGHAIVPSAPLVAEDSSGCSTKRDRSASGRGSVCGFADELMTALPPVAPARHRKSGLPDLRHSLKMRNASQVYPTCGTL